jgi:hypothetical protein
MSSVEIDLTGDDEVPMLKVAKSSNSTTTLGRMMNSGGTHSGGMHSGGMQSGGMGKN